MAGAHRLLEIYGDSEEARNVRAMMPTLVDNARIEEVREYRDRIVEMVEQLRYAEAIELAGSAGEEEAFVAGGAEIYRQCLDRVDRLYLTHVHAAPEGDAIFPQWERGDWIVVSSERHEPDERHAWAYTFEVLERAHR